MKEPLSPDAPVDLQWLEWHLLDPQQRWRESEKLWRFYLEVGGSLDPEPDTQSPFFFEPEDD
jgi:hypothetical protein